MNVAESIDPAEYGSTVREEIAALAAEYGRLAGELGRIRERAGQLGYVQDHSGPHPGRFVRFDGGEYASRYS